MSMTAKSSYGVFQLFENDSLTSSMLVGITTAGKTQFVNDPQQFYDNVRSEMTSTSAEYRFALKMPTINVTTTASSGSTVRLTANLKQDNTTVATRSFFYEAGPDGGPKQPYGEYGGGT